MITIRLRGQVTPDGQLRFDVPDDLPLGDVDITLEFPSPEEQFTEAEVKDMLTFIPTSGAEIIADGLVGGWEDLGITDSVTFVDELRRKQREQRGW
ncbi:MAG: hypothetical protein JNJ61_26385 [Anaerolineae bacterium]|nr:hypothetical protein [Anaerolineae bacterium]